MKLLRLTARICYWKRRALAAERVLLATKSEYEARFTKLSDDANSERWRNIEREDLMVSAAVFGSRGMVGIPPRSGPAVKQAQCLTSTPDPWDAITGAEKLEYEVFYKPDGLAMGLTETQIRQRYMQDLAQRKAIN